MAQLTHKANLLTRSIRSTGAAEKEMVNWKRLRDWPHNAKRHAKHPDLTRGLPLYYKLALQSA